MAVLLTRWSGNASWSPIGDGDLCPSGLVNERSEQLSLGNLTFATVLARTPLRLKGRCLPSMEAIFCVDFPTDPQNQTPVDAVTRGGTGCKVR
jgi:hypothetical protein